MYVLRQKTEPTPEEIASRLSDCLQEVFGRATPFPPCCGPRACMPAGQGGYLFSTCLTKPRDPRRMMKEYIQISGNGQFFDHPKQYGHAEALYFLST